MTHRAEIDFEKFDLRTVMEIEGCTAFVTGSNRGLGKAYVEVLLQAGAAKIYAAARMAQPAFVDRVFPIILDVTDAEAAARAAQRCGDVNLLINNAGAMLDTPMLAVDAENALRREMEVNVFGPLRLVHAFAPILAHNGGGAVVNMLSVVSWYVYPFNATYCTSKFAALAMTNAMRTELKAQGTQVVGVYAGFIDTDMAAQATGEKTTPRQVAEKTLQGLRDGIPHVLADTAAEELWAAVREDPTGVERTAQQLWDSGRLSS
jgi:NAD(P)-dependent dehydrogenase (short-subunit alcohol dehydrogenase family)